MLLDADCMRDILLYLETAKYVIVNSDGGVETQAISFDTLCAALPQHGKDFIYYALSNLEEVGYVSVSNRWPDGEYQGFINRITFSGHEFLSKIHDSERWHGIKRAIPVIRDYSLQAISSIAEGMTAGALTSYFQKNP